MSWSIALLSWLKEHLIGWFIRKPITWFEKISAHVRQKLELRHFKLNDKWINKPETKEKLTGFFREKITNKSQLNHRQLLDAYWYENSLKIKNRGTESVENIRIKFNDTWKNCFEEFLVGSSELLQETLKDIQSENGDLQICLKKKRQQKEKLQKEIEEIEKLKNRETGSPSQIPENILTDIFFKDLSHQSLDIPLARTKEPLKIMNLRRKKVTQPYEKLKEQKQKLDRQCVMLKVEMFLRGIEESCFHLSDCESYSFALNVIFLSYLEPFSRKNNIPWNLTLTFTYGGYEKSEHFTVKKKYCCNGYLIQKNS